MRQQAQCKEEAGAEDRTRTGKALRPTDFHHTAAFAASTCAVRALDYAFTVALSHCRCSPSSLYTFPSRGLARRFLGAGARGFAEFEEIHTGAFAARCSTV